MFSAADLDGYTRRRRRAPAGHLLWLPGSGRRSHVAGRAQRKLLMRLAAALFAKASSTSTRVQREPPCREAPSQYVAHIAAVHH